MKLPAKLPVEGVTSEADRSTKKARVHRAQSTKTPRKSAPERKTKPVADCGLQAIDVYEHANTRKAVGLSLAEAVQDRVVDAPIVALPSGDFAYRDKCGHALGVERKEINDLLGSLAKEQRGEIRLFDQLIRMSADYDHRLLLVEGHLRMNPLTKKAITRRQTEWWFTSVVMLLWSVQAMGVDILWTADHASTIEVLKALHSRATRGCLYPHALQETDD